MIHRQQKIIFPHQSPSCLAGVPLIDYLELEMPPYQSSVGIQPQCCPL